MLSPVVQRAEIVERRAVAAAVSRDDRVAEPARRGGAGPVRRPEVDRLLRDLVAEVGVEADLRDVDRADELDRSTDRRIGDVLGREERGVLGRRRSPGGGGGVGAGVVVVVVVVVGPVARHAASAPVRDAVRGSVPRGRCGSAADGGRDDEQRDEHRAPAHAAHHHREVDRARVRRSVLELVESMISFGPVGSGMCGGAPSSGDPPPPCSAESFASASSRLRQGGAGDPFGALANLGRSVARFARSARIRSPS